ncbi:protein-tyrosine phosphatase-like protein [Entophlyctis helioformis]|nr:protein-tyrosine phosphatase-like protein [Entophlyctis helioformis]
MSNFIPAGFDGNVQMAHSMSLTGATQGHIVESGSDWKYEMRREMQEVIPRLWLGPYTAARSLADLQARGITHVLCIRDDGEKHLVRTLFPDQIVYQVLEVSESPLQNLIPFFPQATAFISAAMSAGGSVLVHCNSGISRSPAIVVAYLIEAHLYTFSAAFQLVQNRRFCINPIEAFKFQLKEYEPIVRTRTFASTDGFGTETRQKHGTRRRYEEDEDSVSANREWNKETREVNEMQE